jgi:O-antigen/teichoic acid export membrane protein
MLAGLGYALLTTLDRWIVALALGPVELGHYTLAALLSSGGLLISSVIAQQFYPRMAMQYGRTGSRRSLFPIALHQCLWIVGAVTPISALVVLLAPVLIPAYLPAYLSSVTAIQILAIGVVPLVAASGFTNLLVTIGRAGVYLMLQVFALIFEVGLVLGGLAVSPALATVAGAAALTYTLFLGASAIAAYSASK